ncbi:hypothetical protein PC9H_002769 [Pleurotus ostreatus]|uniref:Uncharacterized protein n=1 Tax=Pleurotus ostreatus TaxID=5322 RepID=A0A8H6ZIR6_PLEOS|nr:uncharacterized protein PC9H_002769 [Pleurotus ostreatus]KAF7416044.1 hypothetical protein PC9H_002769 [Pleurotus ostreatus]
MPASSRASQPSSRATSPAPSHSSNKSSLSDQIKQKVSSGFNKVKKVTKALTRPLKKKSPSVHTRSSAAPSQPIEIPSDDDDSNQPKSKKQTKVQVSQEQKQKDQAQLGHGYQWFKCSASVCKQSGGVKRYLHTGDRASTTNLFSHARQCFGDKAVDAGTKPDTDRDGSIFAAWDRPGQEPVVASYRQHTSSETRAHLVKWITEANRPIRIVEDRGFRTLMRTGRPSLELPISRTCTEFFG